MKKERLFVISGASGVGKGTVLGIMMDKRKDLSFSVSATTRAPRPGEVDGVHYYFVTKERFEEMIAQGQFLEYDAHAKHYYGTPRAQAEEKQAHGPVLLDIDPMGAKQVRESDPEAVLIFIMPPSMEELERRLRGRGDTPEGPVLLDIDPMGAKQVRESDPEAVLIFIMPPSMEELERRLRGRGDTPEDQIQLRMQRAVWEMEQRSWYDYVVVNDDAQRCADEILNIMAQVAQE